MAAAKWIRALATLSGVALLAALPGVTAQATPPGTNARIVFTSTSEGFLNTGELYSINPDGSDRRRLTWTPKTEQGGSWSPDGTRIAYDGTSDRGRGSPPLSHLDDEC